MLMWSLSHLVFVVLGLYLEVQGTDNWLRNCKYTPILRPLSRVGVGQVLAGLSIESWTRVKRDLVHVFPPALSREGSICTCTN